MSYQVYVVDDHFNRHFKEMDHHIKHKLHEKYSNPHVEKVWMQKIDHHTEIFWVHIKTGHLGNHHHFTVVFECIHHHQNHHHNHHQHHHQNAQKTEYRLLDVHEGHKSIFWFIYLFNHHSAYLHHITSSP